MTRSAAVAQLDIAATPTVAEARRMLAAQFRAANLDTPELDARILTGHVLKLDHSSLTVAADRRLDRGEREAIAELASRRLAREPVARIIGAREFWSLDLTIDTATLVPRPETETVVEAVLAAIDAQGVRSRPLRILDIGTGSGALLLALLSELPNAFGVGTDVSLPAVARASMNATRLKLARAAFIACDLVAPVADCFDVIVSNPPYVPAAQIAALEPEVRDYDPPTALDGGTDGLRFYRRIAAAAPALLADGGMLAVELGAGQAEAVAALFAASRLTTTPARRDLQGIPRALCATKGTAPIGGRA
jgi:release factor glutamine methyltransferase